MSSMTRAQATSRRALFALLVTAASVGAACATEPDAGEEEELSEIEGGSPQPLSVNRDRLFASLAQRKGVSTCDLWSRLTEAERYVFLTATRVLSSHSSYIDAPVTHTIRSSDGANCDTGCTLSGDFICPWGHTIYNDESVTAETCRLCGGCYTDVTQDNTETLLDHATVLYSVNGPDPGGGCGGGEFNRVFLGFNEIGKGKIRNHTIAGGTWHSSDDCAGPHGPFTASENVGWGNGPAPPWCSIAQEYGPQRHHWRYDHEMVSTDGRRGLCGVMDPSLTEIDIDYNWVHDSNPMCSYDGKTGYQHVEGQSGAGEYDWTPGGCAPTPPSPSDTAAGLGCGGG
jgi:hypothetical protein